MAQGSFSQQKQASSSQQQQGRITRTQRIAQEQQQKQAKYNFDMWSAEAERLRSEVFVDKVVQEKYVEYIPKKYLDRYGNPTREWQRMSDKTRNSILNYTRDRDKIRFERTRDVNDPFTFEEYEQEYKKLDPNIQQFFVSPESITAEQERKKQVAKDTAQQKIIQWQSRLQEKKAQLEKYRTWWSNLSSRKRDQRREDFRERENDKERDVEEVEDKIRYLQNELGKIDQGYDVNDLINYAEDKADYQRRKSEAKNKARTDFNKQLKDPTSKLQEDIPKLFKEGEKIDYNTYVKRADQYNKDVAYNNQILAWRDKVGFANLPDFAKNVVNKSAMEWQKKYPTEVLQFDNMGNVVGVESGKLQKSMSLDAYNQFIADNTPEKQYAKWEAEQKNKPIDLDIKAVNVGLLPYETRGTINTQASTTKYIVGGQGGSSGTPQSFGNFLATTMPVTSQIYSGYSWLKDRVHWDVGVSTNPLTNMPQIDIFSFGLKDEKTNVEKWADTGKEKLQEYSQNIDEWVIGKDKIEEFKQEKETKYQEIYQNAFERQYMKKLIYGEVDYETASAEFEKSAEAKRIGERYAEEYGADYKKLQTDVDFFSWKGVGGGVAQTGLGLGSFGINIFDNPLDTGLTVGAVWTGTSVLKLLPTSAQLGLTGAFFVSGVKTTLDPTKTYSERGGGLVTSAITGASLGYAGYRYLKSPVVKTAKIPKPKVDLTASEIIGKDLKMIGNGKSFNKVLYGEQKLSQVSQAGRRTIVTTKWRDLANKYLLNLDKRLNIEKVGGSGLNSVYRFSFKPSTTKLSNIYEGIPSQQRAIYGSDVFRGGRYKITQSGYEKAMKKLMDYGYTKGQATRTLRYYAPKVTEQWLKSGQLTILNDKRASGTFTYETRKPILDLGDGIKTRGGRTVQEVFKVERKIVELNDQQLMLEMRFNVGKYLNKKGVAVKVKDVGFSTSVNKAWASDTRQGAEWLRKQGGMDIYRDPASYKDIYSVSKGGFSITLTPKRTKTIIEIMDKRRSYNLGKTKLFEWELDFDKIGGKNIIIQKGNKGAFGSDVVSKNVDKVVEKITGQSGVTTPKTDLSTGVSNQKVMQLTEQLKGGLDIAPVKPTKMVNIPKVKVDQLAGLDVGLASVSAVKLKQNLKTNNAVKLQLKEVQQLKVNQISFQLLKQQLRQETAQRTAPLLRFQTPTLNLELLLPRLNVPTWKPPPVKPFPNKRIFGNEELKAKIKAKKSKKSAETFALLPDFTSRAIGLAPTEFGSVKDAMKEIKMLQTGFEVRRGGRIKGFSPIDEKSLLKGIMK